VLVAAPGPGVDAAAVDRSIRVALAAAGARVPVTVRVVDTVPVGAAGKRPLVVAFHGGQVHA
jgi:phenylacetate-CoA ligase